MRLAPVVTEHPSPFSASRVPMTGTGLMLGWFAAPETKPERFALMRSLRRNLIETWPKSAYRLPFLEQRGIGVTRLLLNVPEAIQHVLVDNFQNYRRPPASERTLRPILGDGLLVAEGDRWRQQRRIVAPAFTPRFIPIVARHVETATAELIGRLHAQDCERVDLLATMRALSLEIAGRSMFSVDVGEDGRTLQDLILYFTTYLGQPRLLDMILPLAIPSPHDLPRYRFKRRIMRVIERIIDHRVGSPGGDSPRDVFDLLLAARDPISGEGLSRTELRDQVATMLVAAYATTALALFWSLYLLARSPAEQRLLAEEADRLGGRSRDMHAVLPDLVLARAFVSESLRLYPPAAAIHRLALADDVAAGIPIPRHTYVMVSPWVLHRHESLWEAPDVFDASRFLANRLGIPRFSYLPFGAGPRTCVGAQMALAEVTLVVAMIAREFDLSLHEHRQPLPVSVIVTRPDQGVPFRLRRRTT